MMFLPFYKGQRVKDKKSGREGTVNSDYGMLRQTAGVEFDGDKGEVVQVLKADLIYVNSEPEAPHIHEPGHGDVSIVPVELRLGNSSIDNLSDKLVIEFYDRDDNNVAVAEGSPAKMQEFALRILRQVGYTLEKGEG